MDSRGGKTTIFRWDYHLKRKLSGLCLYSLGQMRVSKVHTTFDAISMDAEALGDMGHTVGQLSELTKHCVACHTIYQVDRLR